MSFKSLLLIAAAYTGFRYFDHCCKCTKDDKGVDKASKSSFPASDPPSGNQFTSTEPRNQNYQDKAPAYP